MLTVGLITLLAHIVASMILFGCFIGFLLSGKVRRSWKIRLTTGICLAVFVADSLIWLLVFRVSHGWTDGLWTVLCVYLAWRCFRDAKKLRALQRERRR